MYRSERHEFWALSRFEDVQRGGPGSGRRSRAREASISPGASVCWARAASSAWIARHDVSVVSSAPVYPKGSRCWRRARGSPGLARDSVLDGANATSRSSSRALPLRMICALLGFPERDDAELGRWFDAMVRRTRQRGDTERGPDRRRRDEGVHRRRAGCAHSAGRRRLSGSSRPSGRARSRSRSAPASASSSSSRVSRRLRVSSRPVFTCSRRHPRQRAALSAIIRRPGRGGGADPLRLARPSTRSPDYARGGAPRRRARRRVRGSCSCTARRTATCAGSSIWTSWTCAASTADIWASARASTSASARRWHACRCAWFSSACCRDPRLRARPGVVDDHAGIGDWIACGDSEEI